MAVNFTPVRLESKDGSERVTVTTPADYNNLVFNGGYRESRDQDNVEDDLTGGLDNGVPKDDGSGDVEASDVAPVVVDGAEPVADGDKQVESAPETKSTARRGRSAAATDENAAAVADDSAN